MAVAMVFTVVKVNSTKKIVKAGEGDMTAKYEDDSYLSGINFSQKADLESVFDEDFEPTELTIKVQNDCIKFKLPAVETTQSSAFLYLDGSNNIQKANAESEVLGTDYLVCLYTENFEWDTTYLNNGSTTATLKTDRGVANVITDYANGNSTLFSKANTYLDQKFGGSNKRRATFDVLKLTYEVDLDHRSGPHASDDQLESRWGGDNGTIYYYGENQFIILPSDPDPTEDDILGAESKSLVDANKYLKECPNGAYKAYRRYVTTASDGDGGNVYFTVADELWTFDNIQNYLSSYVTATGSGVDKILWDKWDTPDLDGANNAGAPGEIIAEAGTEITINVKIDKYGIALLKKGDSDYAVIDNLTPDTVGSFNTKITVPAEGENADEYVLTIGETSAYGLTHEVHFKVRCIEDDFALSDVKLDGEDKTETDADTPYYTQNEVIVISAKLTAGKDVDDPEDEGYPTSEVEAYAIVNPTPDDEPLCTLLYNAESGLYEGTIELEDEGPTPIYIIATNVNYSTSSYAGYVVYDTTPPVVDNVVVKQGTTTIEDDVLATAVKNLRIEFELVDSQAGMDDGDEPDYGSVTIANGEGDDNTIAAGDAVYNILHATGNTYYIEIPYTALSKEAYGFIDGTKTLTYTIFPRDRLGNKADSNDDEAPVSRTVSFYNDAATVASIDLSFTPVDIDGKNYYDITDTTTSLYFEVTIESMVPLDVASVGFSTDGVNAPSNKYGDAFSEEEGAEHRLIKNNETGLLTYTFTMGPVNISDLEGSGGVFDLTVSATNVNGFTSAETQEIFYVDLKAPTTSGLSSLKGNTEPDGTGTAINSGVNTYYKDVYIIISTDNYTDDRWGGDYESGLDQSNRNRWLEVDGATYNGHTESGTSKLYAYKVDQYDDEETHQTGTRTVTIRVHDKAGNVNNEISGTFNIDTTAPTITGVVNDEVIYTNVAVDIRDIVITDNVAGSNLDIVFTEIDENGDPVYVDGNPMLKKYDQDDLEDSTLSISLADIHPVPDNGTYIIRLDVTDGVGNAASPIVFTIVYDNAAPVVEIAKAEGSLGVPAGITATDENTGTYSNGKEEDDPDLITYDYYKYSKDDVTLVFTVTDTNLDPSGNDAVSYIKVKNGTTELEPNKEKNLQWKETTEGSGIWTASYTFEDEGEYNISISAKDKSGNSITGLASQTISFTIDKTLPNFALKFNNKDLLDPAYYNGPVGVSYVYTPEDDEDAQEAHKNDADVKINTEYKPADGSAKVIYDTAKYNDAATNKIFGDNGDGNKNVDGDGEYTVTIRVYDLAGNVRYYTRTFTIDTQLPVVDIAVANGDLVVPDGISTVVANANTGIYDNGKGKTTAPDHYQYYKYSPDEVKLNFTVTDTNLDPSGEDAVSFIEIYNGKKVIEPDGEWTETAEGSGIWTASCTFDEEGAYNISIAVTDKYGNKAVLEKSQTISFIIDTTAPKAELLLNGDAPKSIYSENVSAEIAKIVEANLDADDSKIIYNYRAPRGNWADDTIYAAPFTAEGEYKVKEAYVYDLAGNKIELGQPDNTFIIDKNDPDIYISKIKGTTKGVNPQDPIIYSGHFGDNKETKYDGYYRGSGATVTFKVFDNYLSGNEPYGIEVYNKIGNNDTPIEAKITNNGKGEYTVVTPAITNYGKNDIYISVTDKSGRNYKKHVSFIYDNKEPELTVNFDNSEARNGLRKNGKVKVSYDYTDDYKDEDDVTLTYTFTPAGKAAEAEKTINNFVAKAFPAQGEGDGRYDVTITVKDKAGNIQKKSAWFIIDSSVPQLNIPRVSGTAPKLEDYSRTFRTEYNGLEKELKYAQVYSSSKVNVTIDVFDYDLDGNNPESFKVYDHDYVTGADVELEASFTQKAGTDNEYTATVTVTGEGKHHIFASATDRIGNTGDTNGVSFIIDTVDPELSLSINGAEPVEDQRLKPTAKLGYTLTDENVDLKDVKLTGLFEPADGSDSFEISEDLFNINGKNVTAILSRVFPKKSIGEGDGTYTITVTAIDMAGHAVSKTTTFRIDTSAPQLNAEITAGDSPKKTKFTNRYEPYVKDHFTEGYDYGQYYSSDVTIRFTVFDYDINNYSVVDAYNGTTTELETTFVSDSNNETVVEVTIPKGQQGPHSLIAYAFDKAGNNGESSPITFIIDTDNPELELFINEKEPVDGQSISKTAVLSYNVSDKIKVDETDIKLETTFVPAGSSKEIVSIEDLFDESGSKLNRTFPNKERGEDDGTYTIKVTAIDRAGNPVSASTSFIIDNAKPQLDLSVLTEKPAKFNDHKRTYTPADPEGYFKTSYEYGEYYAQDVKVKISVFDYDTDKSMFTVYDNNKAVEANFEDKGNGLYTAEIILSGEGEHIIRAEAADKAGLTGKSSEITFVIDKTAPVLTTTLNAEKYTGTDKFISKDAVVGIKVDDNNPDETDITRYYKIVPSDHSAVLQNSKKVSEGEEKYTQDAYYTVKYTVVDLAGNSSEITIGFTIDRTKPQSDIKITTKDPAKIDKFNNTYSNTGGHFNTEYTYGQYYNESVSMDMAVFDYNVSQIAVTDNGNVIPVTFASNGDERVAAGITVSDEGEHVIKISVTDKSDNTEVSNTVSFIIDKTAPSLSATLNSLASITDQYLAEDASVSLSVSDVNEDENDVTRIIKTTRPGASAVETTDNGALEGTTAFSTEADYEITFTAKDRAGNESSPVTLTFRVDKTAPQLSITGITRDATSSEDVTITYGMIEDFYWDINSAIVKIYKKVDGMGETLINTVDFKASGATSSLSEVFKEDGEYRFEFTAEDKTGNKADESFRFILDENAPVITLTGVDGYLTDKDVSFGVQVDETFYLGNTVKIEGTVKTLADPDGKAINFDDYSRLTRTASANFEQIFTEDGIYNIKVTSKDVAGNETVQSVQFTIDKSKPLIKDLEKLANEEDYAAYVEATGNNDPNAKKLIPIFNSFEFDYEADDIVTDLTTVTYKLYMDGVLYDGLSNVADGFHELRVTAEDEVGNTAERSFYFFLDTVKPGIIVTGVEEGDNLQEATTITISLQLAEDTLKAVAINGDAVAITNNTATIEVNKKGDYVLVVEAADDAGNEATMTIKFEYGKVGSWLWWLIAAGAALIIGGTTFFIILGKKRKKKQQ